MFFSGFFPLNILHAFCPQQSSGGLCGNNAIIRIATTSRTDIGQLPISSQKDISWRLLQVFRRKLVPMEVISYFNEASIQ